MPNFVYLHTECTVQDTTQNQTPIHTETVVSSYKDLLPPHPTPPPLRLATMDIPNICGVFQHTFTALLLFVSYQLRGNSVTESMIFFYKKGITCVGKFVFTKKPCFLLSGYIKSHNIRTRSAENPNAQHENPLHSSHRSLVCGLPKTNSEPIALRRDLGGGGGGALF
jgi:hypothetical protein